jgi:membrane associated rhomboid family serine protease
MNARPRERASGALAVRIVVAAAALTGLIAAVVAYTSGNRPLGETFGVSLLVITLVGALSRRAGIALPGGGFSSYIVAVVFFAIIWRGWPFATIAAPFAIALGDVVARRLPLRATIANAAHLAAGAAVTGFLYERWGGRPGRRRARARERDPVRRADRAAADHH